MKRGTRLRKNLLIILTMTIFTISFTADFIDINILKKPLTGVPLIIGTYFFDEQIKEATTDFGLELGEIIDTKIMIGTSAAFYTASFLFNNDDFSKTAFQSLSSSFVAGSTILALKLLTGRARPYTNEGKNSFVFFRGFESDDYRSLPSAHAGLMWAITTPYAEKYSKWLYIIPTVISGFRVIEDQHWASDVVVGSLIGYLTGKIIYEKDFYLKLFID